MNQKMRELNRLWDGVADRFGIGSDEMEDMNAIITYWECKAQPDPHLTDAQYRTIIAGLKNEMARDQGYQNSAHKAVMQADKGNGQQHPTH